ncbi:hypothetical protein [Aquimarina sp. MMG016]|uniref:hypothetical protein n=1 Tax=Aquimarina sp. MMG016 TaxID=2822690 RepID=UPI001B3A3CEF|nr:hypothetical protein [Aquimarina sp. MMG016]MBQ4820967.1 hypothetical protein [Aquimarina sp. MMG016]
MVISGILKEDSDSTKEKFLSSTDPYYSGSKKLIIMRTLDNNQITNKVKETNSYIWNSKRRYR